MSSSILNTPAWTNKQTKNKNTENVNFANQFRLPELKFDSNIANFVFLFQIKK